MEHKDPFSQAARVIVQNAFDFASQLGHGFVGSEHILWSLSREESSASNLLREAGLDSKLLRNLVEQHNPASDQTEHRMLHFTADADQVVALALAQTKKLGHKQIEPEHLLLGILQEPDCAAAKLLLFGGVSIGPMTARLLAQLGEDWPLAAVHVANHKQADTKTLDGYSRDLTEAAKAGMLDPVIGREKEIQRVVQILSRRTKNNPVLIGEPGVGKTAIAEGLAQRIVEGAVPENLSGRRVVCLDLTKLLSGTKYRGDFEERIKKSIEEAVCAGNIVLFIDELHTLIGAGAAEGSLDAANILKPALSRGEIQVIGATTLREYRKHIEKDMALERRFQPITIGEPTQEQSVEILLGLRQKYEEHHGLAISIEAIHAAVTLSARYLPDRYLPDKAIDLIDEAAARVRTGSLVLPSHLKELEASIQTLKAEKHAAVRNQEYELAARARDRQNALRKELEGRKAQWMGESAHGVGAQDVAEVLSMWTGIPVTMLTEDESARLLRLEELLHRRVVGQDEAVRAVAKAIRRGRVGLKDPRRPMGSFLFLGATGVGKTELCKALAETLFQNEDAMIRMDMSEFMERHTVSKLIGSPPGYVGYEEGGQLTERVRRKPYSVILFDEIEKAHEDVCNILLQIMEDGHLTDSQGHGVDFKNTIIVMTSNVGAERLSDPHKPLGFSADESEAATAQDSRNRVLTELKKTFKPEFLNRIDDVIVFHQLSMEHLRTIAKGMLRGLEARVRELGICLAVDDDAVEILSHKGFDPVLGARPLRRTIRCAIEDVAAERILEGVFREGDCMSVVARDGRIEIEKPPCPDETLALAP